MEKGADALNQSTANRKDLEAEDNAGKDAHLPNEGTLHHMATMEKAIVTQEMSEPEGG